MLKFILHINSFENMIKNLNLFFYPSSVCIVGASTKPKSIGYEILNSIKIYGYTGKIFPVNPSSNEVLGYKCYKSISEITEKIDLAIIVVPKRFVQDSVDQLLTKNVKAIILVTAGFKETGEEGRKAEEEITAKIIANGANLVGPNCMGVINTLPEIKLNATFVAEQPQSGKNGFLSQSGALGAAVLNSLRLTNIKFAHFISVGNKADINENDVLAFWQNDENIETISMYLESFDDGLNFIKPVMLGEYTKPVVILKAGKTESGMRAASSHTGALSSKDKIVTALLNQFGVIRVSNLNELFNTVKGFEQFKIPGGNKVAVVTNAGGPAILAVDKLEEENLILTKLSKTTRNKLRKIVLPEASVKNPVDLLPGAPAEMYKDVIETVLKDENVDAVISIFVEPVMVKAFPVIEAVNSIESDKPVLQVCMPLPEFWEEYKNNSMSGKPVFKSPEEPAEVISNMLFWFEKQKQLKKNVEEYSKLLKSFNSKPNRFKTGYLNQNEIENLLNEYEIPYVQSLLVSSGDNISANEFNFPVVLKATGKEIIHKSELNAVVLDIKDKDTLLRKMSELKNTISAKNISFDGFIIQQYVKPKLELLVGGYRDPSFGPVIVFGTGGKYVETIGDTSIKSAFASDSDIEEMIYKTKIGSVLKGVRNETKTDITKLKKIISSVARMLIENRIVKEIDLNPVILTDENKFVTVDARINIE